MNKKTIYWLHDQLPEWKQKGWITDEVADEIKLHYVNAFDKAGPSMSRLALLFVGVALVFLGVFLLFAGYWYSFSPNGRFDISISVLAVALLGVFFAMWRFPRGSAFSEGAAIFYMLAALVSSYLVGDTFYVGDSFGTYLLLTLFLSIFVIYLLEASLAMFIYLMGSMFWSLSPHAVNFFIGPWSVWLLLLAGIPFYIYRLRSEKDEFHMLPLLSWAYVASFFGAFFFTVDMLSSALTVFFMACLASSIYAIGALKRYEKIWSLPLRGIGVLGLIYVVVVGTFVNTWKPENFVDISNTAILLGLLSLVLSLVMCYRALQARLYLAALFCLTPLVLIACYMTTVANMTGMLTTLVFDAYIVIIIALLFVRGSFEKRISMINGGILAMFALIVARFVDPGFTFLERGTAFLVFGFSVLIINGFYMWRKRRKQERINRDLTRIHRKKEQEALAADKENAKLNKINSKGTPLFKESEIDDANNGTAENTVGWQSRTNDNELGGNNHEEVR